MAYEFGNRLAESTAANQNRNAGVYTRTLIGQTIRETPVPVWTAEAAQHPFVTFEDPSTRKRIGISKDMLSYGFLTLAEPGGGKTNLLNMITRQLLVSQEKATRSSSLIPRAIITGSSATASRRRIALWSVRAASMPA